MQETTAVEVGWWSEIDEEIIACLGEGLRSTSELGQRLGLSDAALTSVLLLLAAEGRVRVDSVALVDTTPG